jgi:hypothetical protein
MDNNELAVKSLSEADKAILQKLKEKAWLTWLRVYPLLFLALIYAYYKVSGRVQASRMRGNPLNEHRLSNGEYNMVYGLFAAFFGSVFLFFAIKDFRRLILPFHREAQSDKKNCISFTAKKYLDPFYDKCLLFYPDKENLYIEVCKEDFESIGNGEELYLEVASVTGEVLFLKSAGRAFNAPAEFSYSDR